MPHGMIVWQSPATIASGTETQRHWRRCQFPGIAPHKMDTVNIVNVRRLPALRYRPARSPIPVADALHADILPAWRSASD
jgi:hypothetical protein